MSEIVAACAHLRVNWKTEDLPDGSTRGWWECADCKMKFVPQPAAAYALKADREMIAQMIECQITCGCREDESCEACSFPASFLRELAAKVRARG